MHTKPLNESLFFRFDQVRSAIAEWGNDCNHFGSHSSVRFQAPADYVGVITVAGPKLRKVKASHSPGCSYRATCRIKNHRGSNRSPI